MFEAVGRRADAEGFSRAVGTRGARCRGRLRTARRCRRAPGARVVGARVPAGRAAHHARSAGARGQRRRGARASAAPPGGDGEAARRPEQARARRGARRAGGDAAVARPQAASHAGGTRADRLVGRTVLPRVRAVGRRPPLSRLSTRRPAGVGARGRTRRGAARRAGLSERSRHARARAERCRGRAAEQLARAHHRGEPRDLPPHRDVRADEHSQGLRRRRLRRRPEPAEGDGDAGRRAGRRADP